MEGYPLRDWLPALAGYIVGDSPTTERFLRDWRETISDMLVDHYFGRLAGLARERGMALSFETAIGDVSPGDILRYQSKADIPMCEIWQPNDPHWGGYETKPILPTVSAAHIYGKYKIAAEAFTNVAHDWSDHPFTFKHTADRNFALGINHLVFHTYTHNPLDKVPGTSFGNQIGSPFIRGQTWWKHMPLFNGYLARCQHLLQQGQPVADVLWYLGDDINHRPRQDPPFPDDHTFDYLNQDVLLNRLQVVDGMLQSPECTTWQVIYLPDESCAHLAPDTLARLKSLLQQGATVIGSAPLENPTLVGGTKADRRFAALVAELWGDATQGDTRIGNGRLIWGGRLDDTLAKLGIEPDVRGLRKHAWNHRRTDDAEIYFVCADRITPLDATVDFRATGIPEFWDPLTQTTAPVSVYQIQDGRTRIPIQLPAAGSIFVIFRKGETTNGITRITLDGRLLVDASDLTRTDAGPDYPHLGLQPGEPCQPWVEPAAPDFTIHPNGARFLAFRNGRYEFTRTNGSAKTIEATAARTIPIDGPWTLSFPKTWAKHSERKISKVAPWSSLDDPDARSFSGTATYRTEFSFSAAVAGACAILDLGRVENIAEIIINGKPAATLWAPPYRLDVNGLLKPGTNHIEIRVTNTWHNRLAFDASLPAGKRKTWTLAGPRKNDPVKPAGLIGPVDLLLPEVLEWAP